MSRTYNQDCAIAYTLDVVGERWSILMLRQLLLGPQRFADLLDALPGMGPNLLTKRLRHLEDRGVVRRAGDGARASQYELTTHGERLRPVLGAMLRWGVSMLYTTDNPPANRPEPLATDCIVTDSFILLMEAFARRDALGDSDFICRIVLEGNEYTAFYSGQHLVMRRGGLAPASASVSTTRTVVRQLLEGGTTVPEALEQGDLIEEGDERVLEQVNAALMSKAAGQALTTEVLLRAVAG